jgi:glycosyltransferase involved in cell wall biosynthesis
VRLVGFAADADLPALYRAADLFAFPSLYEGFGIPILEALGCGTPVVAGNTSSLPEAAGDAALLVDPFDVAGLSAAIWRLLDDSALRNDLRAKGFEQVRRFSWAQAAEQLLAVYTHVARGE